LLLRNLSNFISIVSDLFLNYTVCVLLCSSSTHLLRSSNNFVCLFFTSLILETGSNFVCNFAPILSFNSSIWDYSCYSCVSSSCISKSSLVSSLSHTRTSFNYGTIWSGPFANGMYSSRLDSTLLNTKSVYPLSLSFNYSNVY